ncbi:MAG: histidine kinase [Bacteroidetes bacterium]|nr:MAG: histidine kinase [Bacteroidota bacterium]
MIKIIKEVVRFLKTRLFRNILFWLIFAGTKYTLLNSGLEVLFLTLGLLIFATLAYANNLYFVPVLLSKKKYGQYFAIILPLVFTSSILYVFLVKLLVIHYPDIPIIQVSVVSSPVSTNITLGGIIGDKGFQTYMWTIVEWVFSFTLLWYLNDYASKEQKIAAVEKKQIETELNFLKNQINPHFLFNTFNNLYALALKKSDLAPEIILKLSSILRYILYESNVTLISIETEKEMMQAYIDVELLRLNNKEQLHFSIQTDAPSQIPPLLWLPVLENIFKHSRSIHDAEIDFKFHLAHNELSIYAKNSFVANKPNELSGGIGLTNLKKRLELLYPKKHNLTTLVEGNYYILELHIQLA